MYHALLKEILKSQERYEPGDYADKKKPTYAGFSGVGRHDECEVDHHKIEKNKPAPVTLGLG